MSADPRFKAVDVDADVVIVYVSELHGLHGVEFNCDDVVGEVAVVGGV